jgi:hypothetical protein
LGAGFHAGDVDVITWAEQVAMTLRFLARQDDEAWIVVWPEHLADPRVDVSRLAAAYRALTGRDLPIPAPTPAPPPSPAPTGFPAALVAAVNALGAAPETRRFIRGVHSWPLSTVARLIDGVLKAPQA